MSTPRRKGRSDPTQLGPKPVRVAAFLGSDASDQRSNKSDLSPPPADFWSPALDSSPLNPFFGGGDYTLPYDRVRTVRSPLGRTTPSLPNSPSAVQNASTVANPQSEPTAPTFFDKQYFDEDEAMSEARRQFLRTYLGGVLLTVATMLTVFLIHWGAVRNVPVEPLNGVVVDFDSGVVGLNVSMAILNTLNSPNIAWNYVPAASYPLGSASLADVVWNEKAWVAISVNADASQILNDGLLFPDSDYDGTLAMTVFFNEARSQSIFQSIIRPQAIAVLDAVILGFAQSLAVQVSGSTTIPSVLSTSPQTLVQPVSYTIENVLPGNRHISSIATSAGLLYLLMGSFFIVMFGHRARNRSGLNKQLRLRSLIRLRFASSFAAFFFLSLFYSALVKILKLDTAKTYNRSGFLVLWMLNWIGMLAVGLALEVVLTLIGPCYLLFFSVLWAIVNFAVCINPIDGMSRFYQFGYAIPFYNMSQSVKTIALGTKNQVGLNFGVLIIWALISCISMPLAQRRARSRYRRRCAEEEEMKRIQCEQGPGAASLTKRTK
ncbi:hypothetical protein FA13DRAFT_1666200 [Coprinellus micaceus]|uniref:DUF3533 domain-containing protein n=1 Tax=Coprinellus micaceus TaxID=71717 RepID=A0A4Y7T3C7_COPMI|nr:hypothetical protein FA13DRAFT_1666200 [Coprinellus micaceus]